MRDLRSPDYWNSWERTSKWLTCIEPGPGGEDDALYVCVVDHYVGNHELPETAPIRTTRVTLSINTEDGDEAVVDCEVSRADCFRLAAMFLDAAAKPEIWKRRA